MTATTLRERIEDAFQPIAVPADPPGARPRAQLLQTPSDRLREKAKEFFKLTVGLVPDPAFHGVALDVLKDYVEQGELSLRRALESREDFVGDGFTYKMPGDPEPVPASEVAEEQADAAEVAKAEEVAGEKKVLEGTEAESAEAAPEH